MRKVSHMWNRSVCSIAVLTEMCILDKHGCHWWETNEVNSVVTSNGGIFFFFFLFCLCCWRARRNKVHWRLSWKKTFPGVSRGGGWKEGRKEDSQAQRHGDGHRRPPSATVGHSESRAPAGAVETAKTDSREVKKWAAAGPVIEEWLAAEHEEGKVAEGAGVDCCWLSPLFTAAVGLHSTLYQM